MYDADLTVNGFESPELATSVDESAQEITMLDPENGDVTWSSSSFDDTGMVADLETAGRPIEPRLWSKPAAVKAGGVRFKLVSAFVGESGMTVVLKVTAPDGVGVDTFGVPTYRDPQGMQSRAGYWAAPDGLQEGASSLLMYQFPRGSIGGNLAWEYWLSGTSQNYRVELAVR